MTLLLVLIILIALGLYGLKEYYQVQLGIGPSKASTAAVTALADILERLNENGGRFLDMGSGYGTTVLALSRRLPQWQFTGIEKSFTPWLVSNFFSIGKRFGNYNFVLGDALTWPLRSYDVIFANQDDAILKQWETTLARRLPVGVVLICLNHKLPRARIAQTITIDANTVFNIYQRNPAPAPETAEMVAQQEPA